MENILWIIFELAANLYESFLCIHFIIASFDYKCKILNAKHLHMIGTAVMTVVVTLLNGITVYEGILGVIYSFCFFLFTYIFLRGSNFKKVFISVFTNICLICSTMFVGNVLFFFLREEPQKLYAEHCLERFYYMMISMALLTYVFAILKKFTSGKKDSLKIKEWLLILSVLSVSFVIVAMIQIVILTNEIGEGNLHLLMIAEFGMILINILCFYITVNLNDTHKNEERLALDKKRSEYSRHYAQTIKEQYEQTRRLRHDMKQYTATMLALIKDGKQATAENFAKKQVDYLSKMETVIHVDNDFVNAILNSKLSLAKSKRIDILCSIENNISGIEDIDLCNLIGNLLDNAITAAEKCDSDSRLIEVKISSAGSRLMIVVRNSIRDSVLKDNPKLKSTAKNPSEHGFGVKTIQYIAEKYNGRFDYYEEGLVFVSYVELHREEKIES